MRESKENNKVSQEINTNEPKPYKLSYRIVQENTSRLTKIFDVWISRYIPPDYTVLRNGVSDLPMRYEKELKNKKGTITNKTAQELRLEQIACIQQLLPHLPEQPNSPEQTAQCQRILLGALFYRFYRLEREQSHPLVSFFPIWSEPDNCGLYRAIKLLLNISDEPGVMRLKQMPTEIAVKKLNKMLKNKPAFLLCGEKIFYRENNSQPVELKSKHMFALKKIFPKNAEVFEKISPEIVEEMAKMTSFYLPNRNRPDDLTVGTACKAYFEYLMQDKVVNYYPYVKKDPEYLNNLKKIITKFMKNAAPVHLAVQRIDWICSVGETLLQLDEELESAFGELEQSCAITSNWSKNALIEKLITLKSNPLIASLMFHIIGEDYVLTSENRALFIKTMKARTLMNSGYILLGAYLFCEQLPYLQCPIYTALNIDRNTLPPDKKTYALALGYLKRFMSLPLIEKSMRLNAFGDFEILTKSIIDATKNAQQNYQPEKNLLNSITNANENSEQYSNKEKEKQPN